MEDQKTTALIDEKDHVVRFSLSSITTTNSSSSGNEQHRSSDVEINTNTKQNSETSNQTTNITRYCLINIMLCYLETIEEGRKIYNRLLFN